MSIQPILIAPDPRLKIPSARVEKVTPDIHALVQDMRDTMYASGGIGLAAVQIGVHKQVIVVDVEQDERGQEGNLLVLINPEIIAESEDISLYNEGCLSFPGHYSDVERPAEVTIRYMDIQGDLRELQADSLLATCVQHEIDHMHGIVFVDHISRLKRDMILRKLKKEHRQKAMEDK